MASAMISSMPIGKPMKGSSGKSTGRLVTPVAYAISSAAMVSSDSPMTPIAIKANTFSALEVVDGS